jgi:hypothetical protein
MLFFLRAVLSISCLPYVVYSAATGQWPRATFFLVLYHLGWTMTNTVEEFLQKRPVHR